MVFDAADGIGLIRQVNTFSDAPPLVMIIAHKEVELAVEFMHAIGPMVSD